MLASDLDLSTTLCSCGGLYSLFLFFPPAPYKAPEDNYLKAYGVPGGTCTGEESPCLRAAVIGEYPSA